MMRKYNLLPALLFVAGTLVFALLGLARQRAESQRIRLETIVTAEQVTLRLESCINSRANLVNALSTYDWLDAAQLQREWQQRASTLYPLYSGILALNYVDNDGIIRVIYPETINLAALNADLRQNANPSVIRALAQAGQGTELARTDIVELLQSGKGIAYYKRIASPTGEPLGFVNGVFRLAELMDSCLSEQPLRNRFVFRLSENDNQIFFEQPARDLALAAAYTASAEINLTGAPWKLEFSPSPDYLASQQTSLDIGWNLLGMSLVLLLTALYRALLIKQIVLKDNEDKYRLLVENQSDMVVKVNPAGEFLYVSPSYCRMFGKLEAELLGQQFMPLVHAADREFTSQSLATLLQPPHSSYHEQRAMTKQGWRWLAWSNNAVLNNSGQVEAITAVGRDVTEVKLLEARVAQAQKMEAIGNMAGGISHDFNNLLQVMLGNIEFLIHRDGNDTELQEELNQMGRAIERAMVLTRKLSTLSRQEMTTREIFSINGFIKELQTLLQRTLPESIQLAFTPAAPTLYVKADKTQLEQVLLNLCFNARDALAGAGFIRISLATRALQQAWSGENQTMAPSTYVCISVEDNGSGIAPEVLPRIFEPFFTTKSKDSGTGLGLANCYSIIRQHQGEILVESVEGKGSVFTVYLPLVTLGTSDDGVYLDAGESDVLLDEAVQQ